MTNLLHCSTPYSLVRWGTSIHIHFVQQLRSTVGLQALTSSPRYPQSNGKIEETVKSMKKLLAASWDHRHLNEEKLCNTPSRKDGLSPAQKLFGHPIQDTLPAHRHPEWQKSTEEAEQQAIETMQRDPMMSTPRHPHWLQGCPTKPNLRDNSHNWTTPSVSCQDQWGMHSDA